MSAIHDSARDLSAYLGWYAKPWYYSVTHRQLVVRFNTANDDQEAFLVLSLCERFTMVKAWRLTAPSFRETNNDVTFSDGPVEIVCEAVDLVRKWKPF